MNVKVTGDCLGEEFDPKIIHAISAQLDYTLCGNGNSEHFKNTRQKVNCPHCVEIIEYCKGFIKNKDYEANNG